MPSTIYQQILWDHPGASDDHRNKRQDTQTQSSLRLHPSTLRLSTAHLSLSLSLTYYGLRSDHEQLLEHTHTQRLTETNTQTHNERSLYLRMQYVHSGFIDSPNLPAPVQMSLCDQFEEHVIQRDARVLVKGHRSTCVSQHLDACVLCRGLRPAPLR